MSVQCQSVKIAVSIVAWCGFLLAATYRALTPMLFGQYSWGQVTLLSLLLCIAMMADPLSNHIVSFWIKKAPSTTVAGQREKEAVRAIAESTAFVMGLAQALSEARSYFVYLFMYCKKVTRHLMSTGSHL